MSKIDLDGDGKADISISLPQIITIAAMFASIVGSYYTLSAKIDAVEVQEVKALEAEMRAFMKDIEYLRRDIDNKKR
jgi:hypothetical protein